MMQKGLTKPPNVFTVSAKERWLLEELRKFPFGKAEITMLDGQPDRIELIRESKKYVGP